MEIMDAVVVQGLQMMVAKQRERGNEVMVCLDKDKTEV